MREPRTLSSQAEAEIEILRNKGVVLSDADIVLINALCWEIETPSNRVELARGKPVAVGGVWLWPRTIAAVAWYEDIGCLIGDGQVSLAYSMAHSYDADLERRGWLDVLKWRCCLRCTKAALMQAVACVIEQDEKDEIPAGKKDSSATVSQLAMTMHALHGGEVDMWERRVSMGYVVDMLLTSATQASADGKDATDYMRTRANLALALALDKIVKRSKDQSNG